MSVHSYPEKRAEYIVLLTEVKQTHSVRVLFKKHSMIFFTKFVLFCETL